MALYDVDFKLMEMCENEFISQVSRNIALNRAVYSAIPKTVEGIASIAIIRPAVGNRFMLHQAVR